MPMSFPAAPPMWGWPKPFCGTPQPGHFENPHYHGSHHHGFCHHCCHPVAACCCGQPHCRKDAKELVAAPGQAQPGRTINVLRTAADQPTLVTRMMHFSTATADKGAKAAATNEPGTIDKANVGTAVAFIGGGCCVHLSVEYMLVDALARSQGAVEVIVIDSHQTMMLWGKAILPQTHYEIHEDIITTYAGAELGLVVTNAVARVRWCEVFSG